MDIRKRKLLAWVVAVPILGLLYFQAVEERRFSVRRIGISYEEAEDLLTVLSVEAGSPAEAGGLTPGDQLLEVAGTPVASDLDYGRVAMGFEPGREVTYRVQRGGEVLDLTIRPGTPVDWWGFLINAAACLGHLALGLLALLQWRVDFRARLLTLLALAVALELALPPRILGSHGLTVALVVTFLLLTGFQCATELHLASVIPQRRSWLAKAPWLVYLYYLVGLGSGLAVCLAYLAEVAGHPLPAWDAQRSQWFLNNLLIPGWALAVMVLLAVPALRHPDAVGHHQAGLVLLGVLPWCLLVLTTVVAGWMGRPIRPWIDAAEPLVLLCYPVAVFVAIFQYHLFDLERVVRRGLVYTTLTTALILVFYAALGIGGALLSNLVGEGGSIWVVGAATLLLGLLFSPLRRSTHRLIDRRIFPERDALRRRLGDLAGELPVKAKLPAMGQHLVESLQEIFALRSVTLLLAHSEEGPLVTLANHRRGRGGDAEPPILIPRDDAGIEVLTRTGEPMPVGRLLEHRGALARRLTFFGTQLVVPVMHHEELVGVLLLGERMDDRSFPADEIELLDLFSHHLAAVLENARLFESATHDPLTELLRRENILSKLREELDRARRHQRPLAVAMADLDHFKLVNDRHGHLAGDVMLKRVAQALRSGLRASDALGRYGGEEFLVVLPETDLAGAQAVAEKLRKKVEGLAATTEDGGEVRTTISIGLASLGETVEGEGLTCETLIAAADRSLYEAKHLGRNRVAPRQAAAG